MPVQMFRHEDRARVLRLDFDRRGTAMAELGRLRAAGSTVRLREILDGDPAFDGSIHLLSLTAAGLARPEIASIVLDPDASRTSGPFELGGRWVIFDRMGFEPSRAMTDDEVTRTIEDRLRNERAGAAQTEWLAERRRERSVTVDEDLLDALSPGG